MIPIVPIFWALRAVTSGRAQARNVIVPNYLIAWLIVVCGLSSYVVFCATHETALLARAAFPFVAVPAAAFLTPWAMVRFVYVPLGWSGLALAHARVAFFVFRQAIRTGPAFAAALALSRAANHSEEMEERIVRRITRREVEKRSTSSDAALDGTGVAALAFVAVSRGERDGARLLFRCALDFPSARMPPVVAAACLDWLAADAFDRGDADFLDDLARRNPRVLVRICRWMFGGKLPGPELAPSTRVRLPPAARLLVSLSRHQRHGGGVLGAWPIWWQLVRSGRSGLLPVVRHALGPRPASVADDGARGDALTVALGGHVAAVTVPASLRSANRVRELCARWHRAVGDVAQRLLARELDLGIATEETVVDRLRTAAVEDLARLALDAGAPLPRGTGELVDEVATQMRTEALRSLESAVAARATRIEQRGAVDSESELRDFLAIRDAYERAARLGSEPRRIAFTVASVSIWNHAATLCNEGGERRLAHAQFRWLLREAEAMGHPRIEALRKNVRLSA